MAPNANSTLNQIQSLLAERGYEVSEGQGGVLTIHELGSGLGIQAVLQDNILFLSLKCITVSEAEVTPALMRRMLDAANGISTSSFQLYAAGNGNVAITLNNFCKLQEMGTDDQDDILSCVHFLLIDVLAARDLLSGLLKKAAAPRT